MSKSAAPRRQPQASSSNSVAGRLAASVIGFLSAGALGCDAAPSAPASEPAQHVEGRTAAVEATDPGASAGGALGAPAAGGGVRGKPGCFTVAQAANVFDARKSLAVTDQSILARFPFKRVMDQLAAQSSVAGLTGLGLFQQWWDTQNPGPGLGKGPHCDDERDASGNPTLNGYPYPCRPAPSEGRLATVDPFVDVTNNPSAYFPIGLFNRFDLAPADGRHCGEHRIVYAQRSGLTNPNDRNLVIFEAAIPNPSPAKGLAGCFPIARFWASLSTMTAAKRAEWLEQFYFVGLTGRYAVADETGTKISTPPVVHVDNFGQLGRGQIRTNQFLQPNISPLVWNLREFLIKREGCVTVTKKGVPSTTCSAARVVPVTVKTNPAGGLFNPAASDSTSAAYHPNAAAFQAWFPTALAGLLGGDVRAFAFGDDANYGQMNSGQSLSSGSSENRYAVQLGATESAFRGAIQAALSQHGSGLTPDEVVLRAQTQSCAGCHQLNNVFDAATGTNNPGPIGGGLTWPASLRFVHVSERLTETTDGETRFQISSALTNVFLPHRATILGEYLRGTLGCSKDLTRQHSIGGSRTH